MTKMKPVVHFEMPVENRDRMVNFYTKAFGWKMQMLGSEMGNYVVATTTDSDTAGRPKAPGAINGGFFERKSDWPDQHPSVVISVEDISEAMKNVKDAGGTVLGDPIDIPRVGKYVSFKDTEGNRVSLLQPRV
jgi:uncharacterized protein